MRRELHKVAAITWKGVYETGMSTREVQTFLRWPTKMSTMTHILRDQQQAELKKILQMCEWLFGTTVESPCVSCRRM